MSERGLGVDRPDRGIRFRGETHTLAQWCRLLGLAEQTAWRRIRKLGWSMTQALGTPKGATRDT